MLDLTWGGWIYIFVSVIFIVMAGFHLYLTFESVRLQLHISKTMRSIDWQLKEIREFTK